ncbi:MAG: adenylate/guanylate cyclase domain-containing protein [Alphaproteobacteria bacterium]|nr:adenylate/guanylate cyclase domain-containing protein [Alphaproteobacteria bacterium]
MVDIALLAFTLFVPNPLTPEVFHLPLGAQLRFGKEHYYYIFIAASVFSYSPWLVLWSGLCSGAICLIGVTWIISQPGSVTKLDIELLYSMSMAERSAYLGAFSRVDIQVALQTALLFVMASAILAVAMWRLRKLLYDNAAAERVRSNIARFFSANLVDELANLDEPLRHGRRQQVAVMFADMVSFTQIAEHLSPDSVLALLREMHGLLAQQVFAHGDTLDKYLGDGIMATFGTPRQGRDDAVRALACARAILAAIESWNGERAARGEPPVRIGVGLHHGPVILGDIGDAQRLEFTVIGDTVNVAARVERLTRELAVDLCVTDDLIRGIGERGAALRHGLHQTAPQAIRGRREPIVVWAL